MARTFVRASTEYGEAASAAATAAPITLACWGRYSSFTAVSGHTLLALSRASGAVRDSFVLDVLEGTPDTVRALTGAAGASASGSVNFAIGANTWFHAGAVFSAANSRTAYLNGTGGTANTTSLTPSSLVRTAVGRLPNFNSSPINYWNGDLAEAAIWTTALTANDMTALASGVSPLRVKPASLVFYAPILGASPEPDYTAGGRALTLTGTTVTSHAPVMPLFAFETGWRGAFTAVAGGSVHVPYYSRLVGSL
jgi:hypothetical protein